MFNCRCLKITYRADICIESSFQFDQSQILDLEERSRNEIQLLISALRFHAFVSFPILGRQIVQNRAHPGPRACCGATFCICALQRICTLRSSEVLQGTREGRGVMLQNDYQIKNPETIKKTITMSYRKQILMQISVHLMQGTYAFILVRRVMR